MTENMWAIIAGAGLFSILLTWASLAVALWLTARSSGWSELTTLYEKAFPESSTPRLLHRLGIGKKRPLWYNNAIRARIQNRVLHLRPTIIAKIAHKPLAIPLADLKFETEQSSKQKTQAATLAMFPDRKIWFTQKDADWIQAAQGSH